MDTKRTEKIGSAIYLITSFFDEREPMRWRLRELVNKFVSLRDNRQVVEEIKSLLNIAKNSGLISEANHTIMNRELVAIVPESPTLSDILKPSDVAKASVLANDEKDKPRLTLSVTNNPVIRDKIVTEPKKDRTERKSDREEQILNIVRKKGEVMIKDVAPSIPGVSEKTIQRELLTLVSKGLLKKTGEKRWSRYELP